MLWQQISGFFSHYGFIGLLVLVMVCRASPAVRAVFIKLAAPWAILVGLGAIYSAILTIHQDHLFVPDRWGHHGIRELAFAGGCSVLGVVLIILGFMLFKYQRLASPLSKQRT
jgi:hypothetical protein